MISRVTSQTMMRSAQRNLHANMTQLAKLQDQASGQKAITRPSDDPAATAEALRVRAEQRATGQYARNADNGNGWLATADNALSAVSDIMNRVRDLTVQSATDSTLSPTGRDGTIAELNSLKQSLLTQANTAYMGRKVFAGNSDAKEVFTANPDGGYTSAASAGGVERRISAEDTIRVDTDAAAVFGTDAGSGAPSVFTLIDTVVNDLRAGTNTGHNLEAIDSRMKAIITQHAEVGTRQARLQQAQETIADRSASLEGQRSGIEDVDLSRVILDLKTQEVGYQSALAVTARVLQPTLMDFLR